MLLCRRFLPGPGSGRLHQRRWNGARVGTDLARSDDDRQALQLFFARVTLGRPFVAPPGVPVERVALLRKAFEDTMKDPQLLEEASKQHLTVAVITGWELADTIAAVYRSPRDVVRRTASVLGRVAGTDYSK